MITIICNWTLYFLMRTYLLAVPMVLAIFMGTTDAYAVQFSFDPSTGGPLKSADFGLPVVLIAAASIAGALLIIHERRKANGIWFSNSERLR